jgi:hypothetical protein
MRKNKTGGRKCYTQTIIESEKKKDDKPNPRAGKIKVITHQLVPKQTQQP